LSGSQNGERVEVEVKGYFSKLNPKVSALLIEALEEKNTDRAVELFLVARLLKMVYEERC
jgi:hypothetical protein